MSQGIEDLKEEIQALQARIEELEEGRRRDAGEAQRQENIRNATRRPSPYDASQSRRASSCPHRPQYRNCWCGK